mgnify:CR=1 FL=1
MDDGDIDARIALYEAAIDFITYQGNLIWQSANAFLLANSFILAATVALFVGGSPDLWLPGDCCRSLAYLSFGG